MANGTTNGWTAAMDETLRAMHAEKKPYPQIGAVLGKTRSAVSGRMVRLGLSKPAVRISPEERKRRKQVYYRTHRRSDSPAKVQRRAVVIAELAGITPGHLSLIDLPPNGCKWPYGDGPFTFCGCDRLEGKPYCYPHHMQATEPARERRMAA